MNMTDGIAHYMPEAERLKLEFAEHKMNIRHPSEGHLQQDCYLWWNKNFRQISDLYSVPNGGTRIYAEVQGMISQGLKSGVFDLTLLVAGEMIAIEMKNNPKNYVRETQTYLDPKQLIHYQKLKELGFKGYCCKNFFEFALVVCYSLGKDVRKYL